MMTLICLLGAVHHFHHLRLGHSKYYLCLALTQCSKILWPYVLECFWYDRKKIMITIVRGGGQRVMIEIVISVNDENHG